MKTVRSRVRVANRQAELFHVMLRGSRAEALVRDEDDRRKLIGGIESMLFWCGGRAFGCRCEGDRLDLLLESARVPPGGMLRYVTVSYALYLNRVRGRTGRVFRPLRVYLVQRAFRTEFVLWLHRPLSAAGWTADAAYVEPGSMPWVDTSQVLDELGRGPGARRQYRALRARGIDEELLAAFDSPRGTLSDVHTAVRPARTMRKRRQRELLRAVLLHVAQREAVSSQELTGRTRARRIGRARSLVTLVAVRCGVSLTTIAEALGRDGSTLEESVLRQRARDPQGLLNAAGAILAVLETEQADQPGAGRQTSTASPRVPGGAVDEEAPAPASQQPNLRDEE